MRNAVLPVALAEVLDFAERPRIDDWSLRSALVRYAQPQPERAGALFELVRRIEFGLRPHVKAIERDGEQVWRAVAGDGPDPQVGRLVVGLLRAMQQLDRLGDALAEWAVDVSQPRPDAAVDDAIAAVTAHLDELGAPREQRQRQPRVAQPERGV